MTTPVGRGALLSLEPWDEVWRRNQHLAKGVVESGVIGELLFVEPVSGGLAVRAQARHVHPSIRAVEPPLVVPRRYGGHRFIGRWLRHALRDVDLIWVNDPVAGSATIPLRKPMIYDVTDDWRSMPQPDQDRRRIIQAENDLARHARTVVCSQVLADRWRERYGMNSVIIRNAVDLDAYRDATPSQLSGSGPHLVYVGTLHTNRLDLELVCSLAPLGSVHLIGPNYLGTDDQQRLTDLGVQMHGPVPAPQVPRFLAAADVLICPHVVDEFTLSLDAIKASEYLSTSRPIVATPSSGFQALEEDGLALAPAAEFQHAVRRAIGTGPFRRSVADWSRRAAAFRQVIEQVCAGG